MFPLEIVQREDFYHGRKTKHVRRFPKDIHKAAYRKLDLLNSAQRLDDLRSPPGNRLKALKGDWKGYFSIRVNDQWRIVFRWADRGAKSVSLTDYH